ncbi:MAG: SAM-dependent methyltransferase [Planctomycetota bacterium]
MTPVEPYVTRAGRKLEAALAFFRLDVAGKTACDLGSHIGGFVDCLLAHGVARVYSVDTSYGTLAWKLRNDPRVIVMERTNAMHVRLDEPVHLVTADLGWTRQERFIGHALTLLTDDGLILSLLKPQYEARRDQLARGVVPPECLPQVLEKTQDAIKALGASIEGCFRSPLRGRGGNAEYVLLLKRAK